MIRREPRPIEPVEPVNVAQRFPAIQDVEELALIGVENRQEVEELPEVIPMEHMPARQVHEDAARQEIEEVAVIPPVAGQRHPAVEFR